jgi:flagellar basal body rod protein FlgC
MAAFEYQTGRPVLVETLRISPVGSLPPSQPCAQMPGHAKKEVYDPETRRFRRRDMLKCPQLKRSWILQMSSLSSIALSGMNAAQTLMNASSHNVANLNTAGFRRQQVIQTEQDDGGVSTSQTRSAVEGSSLETDVVAQLQARNSFLANLAVFKAASTMTGKLLHETA